jgi:carbonic anhydrase
MSQVTKLAELLERNRAFAATDTRSDVPALPFQPRQQVYILTCIDCRVDPSDILGVRMGDALVQRTIGGRVTEAVLADIAYAAHLVAEKTPDGPWFEVAIVHHTDCGSALLADDGLRHRYAQRIGTDERTLTDTAVLDPTRTAITDVHRVRRSPALPRHIAVSGHVYDVDSGLITTVMAPTTSTP